MRGHWKLLYALAFNALILGGAIVAATNGAIGGG
jgi:hypothetical protein